MKFLDIHAVAAHLARLVDAASSGQEIVIIRDGRAVARLLAATPEQKRAIPGNRPGKFDILDDLDVMYAEEIRSMLEGA